MLVLVVTSLIIAVSRTLVDAQDDVGFITAQPQLSKTLFASNIIKLTVEPPDATCGLKGTETLCDVDAPSDCFSCTDELPSTSYPPELMLDQSTTTFWQSTHWEEYPLPFDVNITLSFGKVFQMENIMTFRFKDGHLPSQATLEKSIDFGKSWEVFQYFSTDCLGDFGMASTVPVNIENATQVICTNPEIYARDGFLRYELFPRYRLLSGDDGSFVNQLNQLLEEDVEFRNFFSFTDISLHLMRPYDAQNIVEPISSNRYHYSIQDIFFFSSCHCNLHGGFCVLNDAGTVVCNCTHNTEGKSCERCKQGFRGAAWQPASFFPFPDGSANECIAAEDSATTMMSVETVFQSTSAVTMETVRTETESPDTTATLGAVMTTSGALPATRDATSGTLLVLVATAILMMHRIQLYELL